MGTAVEQVSAMLQEAWSTGRQAEFGSMAGPGTAQEAYEIQDRVFAARFPGQRVSAWKAGGAKPGAEMSAAPIGTVLASPAEVPGKSFHMLGIEAEVAFRIQSDLGAKAGAWSIEEVSAAIGEILVTLEICDTRLANWKSAPPLWRLADFQLNGALVTGSGIRDWRKVDFAAQQAELWVNGNRKSVVTGSHPLGDPLSVMPWIAGHCARRSGGLKRGDLVTTGSWTGMEFLSPGDSVMVRFPGIGEAGVKISA